MSRYEIKLGWLSVILLMSFASFTARSIAQDAPPAAANKVVTIEIKDFNFVPETVTIEPGQTVVWINSDDEPHAVAAADKSFRSASLDTGERYTRTFTGSGEFNYYCSFHSHMTGKVVVKQRTPAS